MPDTSTIPKGVKAVTLEQWKSRWTLETTNEELQSTNEELETTNEELQSTNEELETTNDELQLRTDEINRTKAFLNAVLGGLRAGVAVLDSDFTVLAWNRWAEELWEVRADEARGRSIFVLDTGLPWARCGPPFAPASTGSRIRRRRSSTRPREAVRGFSAR